MGLDYWPCYHSYFRKCEKLSDQELGRLFRALMEYSITGEAQQLAGRESIAFDFIADDIRRAKENYDAKCQKYAENAAKRYADADDGMPLDAIAYDGRESKSKYEYKSESKSEKKESTRSAHFKPPSVEEVSAYCLERNNGIDAEQFCDFYASKGWKVGREPMKDWKAAVRTWERKERPKVTTFYDISVGDCR